MRYLLLTISLLVSICASAEEIEYSEIDFSRCPEVKKHIVEFMKTVNADCKTLGLKGPKYYFMEIRGRNIKRLDLYVTLYISDLTSYEIENHKGFTIIGNDTILIRLNVGFNAREKFKYKKKKINVRFYDYTILAKPEEIIKIHWSERNRKITYRIDYRTDMPHV